MTRIFAALALALLAALPARAATPMPAAATVARPGLILVEAEPPVGAAVLCAATARAWACVPAASGAVLLDARAGEVVHVWAADRPYVVGGVQTVLGSAELVAPGFVAFLPLVEAPE